MQLEDRYQFVVDRYVPWADVKFIECTSDDLFFGEYDGDAKTIVLTDQWMSQEDPNVKMYVVLHEIAHAGSWTIDPGHSKTFYELLKPLVYEHKIPGDVAREIEQIYPESWKDIL